MCAENGGIYMLTAEKAKEVLAEMRRDGTSLNVEEHFLAVALKIGRLTDGAKLVYANRIANIGSEK
jgi:hypothetical protein